MSLYLYVEHIYTSTLHQLLNSINSFNEYFEVTKGQLKCLFGTAKPEISVVN